jgi:hypothetical protein
MAADQAGSAAGWVGIAAWVGSTGTRPAVAAA